MTSLRCAYILTALERRVVAMEFVRVRQHSPGGASLRPDLDSGYCAVQRVSLFVLTPETENNYRQPEAVNELEINRSCTTAPRSCATPIQRQRHCQVQKGGVDKRRSQVGSPFPPPVEYVLGKIVGTP